MSFIQIHRFIDQETSTHSYLIYNNKQAAIIDPVLTNFTEYLSKLESLQLNLIYSIETHIHADHITAGNKLREHTNCKIVVGDKANVQCADIKLKDGDELKIGDLILKTLYTPGHTIESCCYLVQDRLFTGDCLFINGCGRTDFQNGSSEEQYNSIFKKLLVLPDETLVYPGHDYNNKMVSTIAQERINNPRLQINNAHEFTNIMDNLNLSKPKYMDIAVPRNLICGNEV